MDLQLDPHVTYALALEGGGAKGAYQIGVWRALREAGLRIGAVAGTSVGALNGAMIAMDDLDGAEALWSSITYSRVMNVNESALDSILHGELPEGSFRELLELAVNRIREGGIDVTPLRELIEETVSGEAVRASETELYIVTYSVTDRRELELRARELSDEELCDMLMASANLPVFKPGDLGGKRYADGGVRDVLPLHVLIENGYRDIIAVRLFGPGLERPVHVPRSTEIRTVEPRRDLGGTLEFDALQSRENLRLGYLDGMRMLYGLRGRNYYIDMTPTEDEARAFLCRLVLRSVGGWSERAVHEQFLPELAKSLGEEDGGYRDILAALMEKCAASLALDELKLRSFAEMLAEIGGESACETYLAAFGDSLRAPAGRVRETEFIRRNAEDGKLRVCLLNDSFPPMVDGVAAAVLNYANRLTERGDFCAVATPAYPDAVDDYPFPVVRYPSLNTTRLTGYRAGNPFSPSVTAELADMDFDIIHTHCPVASALLAGVLRESVNAPVILTYHTKFDVDIENTLRSDLLQEAAVRMLAGNVAACDEVWVVSEGAGENLRSLGYEGDYIVMPNGVDLPRGRADEGAVAALRKEWHLETEAPVYLFCGRIMWYKGLRIILEGLRRAADAGQDFRMVFVGDGRDRAEVEVLADSLGLSGRCRFVGEERDRGVIRAWYTLADLFLFPSSFDTNGLVVREAAACSLPSVLLRGSCAAEGVIDGRTGLLIDENAESLAAVLTNPAHDRAFYRTVGERACREIYRSWDDAVDAARERYGVVLERWNSGELRRRRTKMDEFFDRTADLGNLLERSKTALESMLERYF